MSLPSVDCLVSMDLLRRKYSMLLLEENRTKSCIHGQCVCFPKMFVWVDEFGSDSKDQLRSMVTHCMVKELYVGSYLCMESMYLQSLLSPLKVYAPVNNTTHYPIPALYRGIDQELTGVFPPRIGEIDMGY